MNPCVLTGAVFIVDGERFTGDLFCHDGKWSVRGANPNVLPASDPREPCVTLLEMDDREERPGTRWLDWPWVRLVAVSNNFREHVREYYPEHVAFVDALPSTPVTGIE